VQESWHHARSVPPNPPGLFAKAAETAVTFFVHGLWTATPREGKDDLPS